MILVSVVNLGGPQWSCDFGLGSQSRTASVVVWN